MSHPASLTSLPNELLLHILIPIRTLELLPLSALNHRFHSLVVRIVKQRLTTAASLCGHTLLLECFHPSARLTQPTLTCSYLGTHGLDEVNYMQNECGPPVSSGEQLRNMRELYSSYKPHRGQIERKFLRRHPAGDIPGSRTYTPPSVEQAQSQTLDGPSSTADTSGSSTNQRDTSPEVVQELIVQLVHLDANELFSQLCAQTIVALTGPKPGIFRKYIEVSNGIVRVWRNWLAKQNTVNDVAQYEEQLKNQDKRDSACSSQEQGNRADFSSADRSKSLENVLWVNDGQNVGVHFRVKQRKWRRDVPVLFATDEDVPVSYDLEYDQLLVRTMHLLVKMEETTIEDPNISRKAIVFGSFG